MVTRWLLLDDEGAGKLVLVPATLPVLRWMRKDGTFVEYQRRTFVVDGLEYYLGAVDSASALGGAVVGSVAERILASGLLPVESAGW